MSWRIGVDTGGTFTDVVAVDGRAGVRTAKVSSTPPSFEVGILNGIRALGLDPADVSVIHHGTTVTTNAAITKSGARTALLTTKGFRDVLELRRGHREDLYDIAWDPPSPLVRRAERFEIDERTNYAGDVHRPVDRADVSRAASAIRKRGIDAVAISFLHSYANPANELAVLEQIAEELPSVFVTSSADILPEPPEFERTATAVANAYLGPPLIDYLERLEAGLRDAGYRAGVLLMHSGGGVMTVDAAMRLPVRTAGSGPAAGVMGAAAVGRACGRRNVISMDMGGTSCDVAVIVDGRARLRMQHDLEWGLPIKFPSVDFVTIGAGGGSIQWIDSAGYPRSGPDSAGATPGPAAYLRGGTKPTITDANVVMNRVSGDARLGDDLTIHADAALRAIDEGFAGQLGMEPHEAAAGAVRIANANMASAVRLVTVQKGLDPRDFSLIAFGGAGPLHAVDVAREVGIPEVIVPPGPGLISALGLHTVDVVHDLTRSFRLRGEPEHCAEAEQAYRGFEASMRERLEHEGASPDAVSMTRQIDLRYVGQAHLITVDVPDGRFDPTAFDAAVLRFHAAHEREYRYCRTEWPVEAAVLRLQGRAKTHDVDLAAYGGVGGADRDGAHRPATRRDVYFEGDGWCETTVLWRTALQPGAVLAGPVVIEDASSTVVIPPRLDAAVDDLGNIVIALEEAGHGED